MKLELGDSKIIDPINSHLRVTAHLLPLQRERTLFATLSDFHSQYFYLKIMGDFQFITGLISEKSGKKLKKKLYKTTNKINIKHV